MREIHVDDVLYTVARLCREANVHLPNDVVEAIQLAAKRELSATGQDVLQQILENAMEARQTGVGLCQDGGMTIVFMDIGQDVHITGGLLEDAVNAGIAKGYGEGHLRGSILNKPFGGVNSKMNTPGIIHTHIVPGDQLSIAVLPKGGGADNMSQMRMLTPAAGVEGVKAFILDVVRHAGPNACPPLIVGVGIGGTFDSVGALAKRALLREVGTPNSDEETAELERELLEDINDSGIGPMGLGGQTTALAVHIETHPLHMASLPVAVNLQCHSARLKRAVL